VPVMHGKDCGEMNSTFVCMRCGNCCRLDGDVIVSADEREKICQFLGIGEEEFLRKYAEVDGAGFVKLRENGQGACVFLGEDNLCMIHPVKPKQCREFPVMWRSKNIAEFCEGFRRMIGAEFEL